MSYPVLIVTKNHDSVSSTIYSADREEDAIRAFDIIAKNEYEMRSKGIPTHAILLFKRSY